LTKPAPYPPTAIKEVMAINTLRELVDENQVMLHIRQQDTVPDIDGDLDILDQDHRPIGKLEIQVKKLPDDYGTSPKLQIRLSIFGYASITTSNPVLLVGVNVHQKKAYWYHVPMNVNPPSGQETVTVHFPLTQVIDRRDTRYVVEWLAISQEHHRKLREYDKLQVTLSQLSKRSTLTTAGSASPGFREIHEFLDELNALLDGPFSLVKRRFYPGSWKVGLAYRDFSSKSITYTLYPIQPEENSVQIRTIDATQDLLSIDGIRGYFVENPIKIHPKQHAVEVIEESMRQIFEGKLLDHKGSDALAREFMFAIIDRFTEQLGLEKKGSYTLAEIETAFYSRLPIWVEEAVRLMVRENRNGVKSPLDCLYRKPYFNPDMLSHHIMPEEMKKLDELVTTRIERHGPVPKIPIGYKDIPLGLFEEYHSYLISNDITEIHRLYDPPDYSRIPHGGYFWDAYSPESVQRNLQALFTNLPPAYSGIVEQNFPQLKGNLLPFLGATRVIAFFDAKDQIGSIASITLCYLRCKDENGLRIELFKAGQDKDFETKLDRAFKDHHIELDGKSYEYVTNSSGVMRFKYDELAMFDFIYEELEGALHGCITEMKESKN